MPRTFDYTTQARAFTLRFPLLTHVLIQINFWIIAFILMVIIIYFSNLSLVSTHNLSIPVVFPPAFWSAVIIGIFFGVLNGLVDWRLDKGVNRRLSLGLVILVRGFLYVTILVVVMVFLRYVLWERIIMIHFYDPSIFVFTEDTWKYVFYIFAIYTFIMSFAISFINQMNRKFGPGILVPMLFGKYRHPIEEDRIFMFLDMKSSTTIAERLGHKKYSSLIQDCFLEINDVLLEYSAEIYQYVGDEIVICWLRTVNLPITRPLDFFFGCQRQFEKRREYYENNYGLLPQFKAGVHWGVVMAVEVGDIKREIAYHGDTLNTTARIQSVCNEYDQMILISGDLVDEIGHESDYKFMPVGELKLKGKDLSTRLFSVEK